MNAHMVEEELQLFIGQVDTGLLETVLLESLEAEDIQDANLTLLGGRHVLPWGQQLVDLVHDPAEQSAVQDLGYGITGIWGR